MDNVLDIVESPLAVARERIFEQAVMQVTDAVACMTRLPVAFALVCLEAHSEEPYPFERMAVMQRRRG